MQATLPKHALDNLIDRIVEAARPRKVILFGSAARGTMGPNSDADVLVVVDGPVHRRQMAQAIYRHLVGVGFAADVLVVTPEDVERYQADPGYFLYPALTEGRVVYG